MINTTNPRLVSTTTAWFASITLMTIWTPAGAQVTGPPTGPVDGELLTHFWFGPQSPESVLDSMLLGANLEYGGAGPLPSGLHIDTETMDYWLSATESLTGELPPNNLSTLGLGLPPTLPTLVPNVVAKATPDECWEDFGEFSPIPQNLVCPEDSVAKSNHAYVWGLTKKGDRLWWGTGPNIHCLVIGGFLGQTSPVQTGSYVCEFGEQTFNENIPAVIGDWRPPQLYSYNTETRALIDRRNQVFLEGTIDDIERLNTSLGIRSAGANDEIVFLAGPSLLVGINIFAFDAVTGDFLGSANFPQYSNIRKWLDFKGELYTAVQNSTGMNAGSVLKWTGTLAAPFTFDVVGNLDGEGANLASYKGRIAVTTWPSFTDPTATPAFPGLFISEIVPETGGLTTANADNWEKVWQSFNDQTGLDGGPDGFDPDPLVASTYGGGDLIQFGDKLYWGTMHVPFLSYVAYLGVYGGVATDLEQVFGVLGTYRPITIFCGELVDDEWETEVVYGENWLPAYVPGEGWTFQPTGHGFATQGRSGFGNVTNNYTWTMTEFNGSLFIGTMDFKYLIADAVVSALDLPTDLLFFGNQTLGADLWRIDTPGGPAVPESLNGAGNFSSYGIRTMCADEDALYLGMANPMNLLTATDDILPQGGWELICMLPFEACLADVTTSGAIDGTPAYGYPDGIVDTDDLTFYIQQWIDGRSTTRTLTGKSGRSSASQNVTDTIDLPEFLEWWAAGCN